MIWREIIKIGLLDDFDVKHEWKRIENHFSLKYFETKKKKAYEDLLALIKWTNYYAMTCGWKEILNIIYKVMTKEQVNEFEKIDPKDWIKNTQYIITVPMNCKNQEKWNPIGDKIKWLLSGRYHMRTKIV